MRFAIAGVPGTPIFEGTLDAERLTGTFTQGGVSFPFELERVDEGVAPADEPAPAAAGGAATGPGPGPLAPAEAAGEAADVHEDPAGLFSVPVPRGWTVEERDEHFALASPEGGIRLYFVTPSEDDLEAVIERAWAVVDPGFDVPVDAVGEVLDELEAFIDRTMQAFGMPVRRSPSSRTTRWCTPPGSACEATVARR